jgi:hypothetical protein
MGYLQAWVYGVSSNSAERLAVAPAKWKLEFKKDVIAGCHERLVRFVFHHGPGP